MLGEAHYSGRAIKGALELNVRLGVTLGRPGQWKIVPLIGEDVVLARATVAGQPIAISTLHGYQVWMTQQTGEIAGKVTDVADGSAISEVGIRATGANLPGARTTTTNASGDYRLPALPPGEYTLVYTLPDGSTRTRMTDVLLQQRTTANLPTLG